MGNADDTQKPLTQQQGNTVEDENTVESQLISVTNRIKFVLELLGAYPDRQFPITRQYLEAELIAWLNDLESVHDLYVHQQPSPSQGSASDAEVPQPPSPSQGQADDTEAHPAQSPDPGEAKEGDKEEAEEAKPTDAAATPA